MSIIVTVGNTPPVAKAGPDQTVQLNATVQLDGSTSTDADNNPLSYTWSVTSKPTGSTATLSSISASTPTFVADKPGTYVLQLIVNDGQVNGAPDTVSITTANSPPVANAGVDQTVKAGDRVQLDGSTSSDADGDPLTYSWSFTAVPQGAIIPALSPSETAQKPTFVASTVGVYVVQLIVNDTHVNSAPDTATITMNVGPSVSLTPNPLNLTTSATGTLTVTLSSTATAASGVTVALSSSNSTVASVPASVTVAQNQTTAPVQVTSGTTAGAATITATASGFSNGTATVNVTARTMTLTPASTLIGVGRTVNATLALAQPAPTGGVTVNLSSNATSIATISPASVIIAQGATAPTTPITITGIGAGPAVLNGQASGFTPANANITITSSLISLGSGVVVAPGQSSDIALSLSAPAPAGGVTITLVSSNTALATVTASVVISQGQTVPAANPLVTGVAPGTVQIMASEASGKYASDSKDVQVALTLSFTPTTLSVAQNSTASITLKLSAPAPQPNGLTVNLSTTDTNKATVPATVTVVAGSTSAQITVTAKNTTGDTTLNASATGAMAASATITVTNAPPLTLSENVVGSNTIGKDLQTSFIASLGAAAPAGNLQVTITSADETKVVLSTSATTVGSKSITVQANAGSFQTPAFFVQALAASGTVQLTATATGYANGTVVITLGPSGFVNLNQGTTFTAPLGQDVNLSVFSVLLEATTLKFSRGQAVRAGLTVQVPITSSDTTVGTITSSPVTFQGGETNNSTSLFHPLKAGTSVVSVGVPAGFSTPSEFRQSTATVTAAKIFAFFSNSGFPTADVGRNLQEFGNVSLETAPPSAVTVTVTSNGPAIAMVSTDGTVAGGTTITFPGVTTTSVGQFFVQGLQQGSTTLTISAPGYSPTTVNVTVGPSGFVGVSDFSASLGQDVNLSMYAALLDATTLNIARQQAVRGGLTVSVPITSSDTTVGTITGSPVSFQSGDTFNSTAFFHPLKAGTSAVSVGVPAGFSTPSNGRQGTATVTP